jgi:hypothetical protein
MRRTYILFTLVAVLSGMRGGQAQTRPANKSANDWMKIPTDAAAKDDVPGAIRYERDQIFDKALGYESPLTPESAPGYHIPEGGVYYPNGPSEFNTFENRAVLIGTFTKSKGVVTQSGRAIYEDVSGHATPGSDITLIFAGGAIKTGDGRVISFLLDPRTYFPQPGRTYLMVLGYHPDGDFYGREKEWDVSDGIARPNSDFDRTLGEKGRSSVIGLTTDQLIRFLNERFSVRR